MKSSYDTGHDWGNQLNTYRDDRIMPTCRLKYISEHPKTQLANLHSSDSMIAPTWGKVSQSVWQVYGLVNILFG